MIAFRVTLVIFEYCFLLAVFTAIIYKFVITPKIPKEDRPKTFKERREQIYRLAPKAKKADKIMYIFAAIWLCLLILNGILRGHL